MRTPTSLGTRRSNNLAGRTLKAILLILLTGCWYRTPAQVQRDQAKVLRPAEVEPARPGATPPRELRALRLRAWVDDDYQRQTPRWRQQVSNQIENASTVLERQFGVRLVIESIQPWRRPGSSLRIEEPLEQLAALDPGEDVDWVVGFISSLEVFSATQEQLGMARLFGRHFVLRGMFSAAETDAIASAFHLLSVDERAALTRERRLHKEMAVFLHEWAHTLGAIHERSNASLMSPVYDDSQSGFSEAGARLIEIGLGFNKSKTRRDEWMAAWRAELDRSAGVFDEPARATALTNQTTSPGEELSAAEARTFNDAVAQEHKGEHARAAELLAPLLERHPHSSEILEFWCGLAQARRAPVEQQASACRGAAALPGAPPSTLLVEARLLLAGEHRAEAVPLLVRAEARASKEDDWTALAQLGLQAGCCTLAERAATHVRSDEVSSACARLRGFVGFSREALAPAREADYVAAALAAHKDIDDRAYERALARAHELSLTFPGAPAARVIECRARSRGRALAFTKTACTAAAAGAPDAFLPQYLLGLVASAESRWTEAESFMRRAIEIDAGTPQVWASLAALQQQRRESAALRELQKRYRAQFGVALVPSLWPAGWAAR